MPVTAGVSVANVKVVAHEYYDEYAREWHLVDSICIRELTGTCQYVEQECGGESQFEVELNGLPVETQYMVRVCWVNGTSKEETYTVYEAGQVNLWIDLPSNW